MGPVTFEDATRMYVNLSNAAMASKDVETRNALLDSATEALLLAVDIKRMEVMNAAPGC